MYLIYIMVWNTLLDQLNVYLIFYIDQKSIVSSFEQSGRYIGAESPVPAPGTRRLYSVQTVEQ